MREAAWEGPGAFTALVHVAADYDGSGRENDGQDNE